MLACALRSVQRAACLHAPAGAPMRVARLVPARALERVLGLAPAVVLGPVPERALADVLEIVHKLVLTGVGRGVQQTVLGHA